MGLTGPGRLLLAAALLAPLGGCDRADAIDAADAAPAADTATAAEAALPTAHAGPLTLSRLVAPAPIADAPMALYVAIGNSGPGADTLLSVAVDGARAATLHETAGGTMRPVARLAVPAGGTVALRPGGLHLMIEGVAPAPVPGDTLRATLRFARAGDVRVAAPVVAYAALERVLGADGGHAGH